MFNSASIWLYIFMHFITFIITVDIHCAVRVIFTELIK